MDGFERLQLSTETLRELTRHELAEVAGGAGVTQTCPYITPTTVIVKQTLDQITRMCW